MPETPARDWVIRKNGYFYRANRSGYTMEVCAAGRYTEQEARAEARVEPHSISAHPLSEFVTMGDTQEIDALEEIDAAIADAECEQMEQDIIATLQLAKAEITRLRSELKMWHGKVGEFAKALEAQRSELDKARIPEGWQLVPKEPTREMLSAGALARHSQACDGGYSTVGRCAAEVCWPAMLAAAPSPAETPRGADE